MGCSPVNLRPPPTPQSTPLDKCTLYGTIGVSPRPVANKCSQQGLSRVRLQRWSARGNASSLSWIPRSLMILSLLTAGIGYTRAPHCEHYSKSQKSRWAKSQNPTLTITHLKVPLGRSQSPFWANLIIISMPTVLLFLTQSHWSSSH